MLNKTFRLLCATIASSAVLNSIQVSIPFRSELLVDSVAYARRSGGRSGGGSFSRPSSPSRSSPSRSSGSDSGGSSRPYGGGGYYGGGYGGGYYGGGYGGSILSLVALLLVGGAAFFVWYLLKTGVSKSGSTGGLAGRRGELENDTVTVTKVQVGLLAEGREIQTQLAEIVRSADTDSIEGLYAELQESMLALLRMPENWSHVSASSQTVKTREAAEKAFTQLSIVERTKYTTETLTNTDGDLVRKAFELDPEKDPAAYIVVTLLLGTADDKPLFAEIRTAEALKETLSLLASLNPKYLMRFELQWTPEAEGDRLTYDEMLTDYPAMLQI